MGGRWEWQNCGKGLQTWLCVWDTEFVVALR